MEQGEVMTHQDYENLVSKLEYLENQLKGLRLYKGTEAVFAGDAWHDNPTLYQVEMEERVLMRQISLLRQRIHRAQIVEPGSGAEMVAIGMTVKLQFDDGAVEEFRLSGVGDPLEGVVSIYSPLGEAILGARVGDRRKYRVGSTSQGVTVLSISAPDAG